MKYFDEIKLKIGSFKHYQKFDSEHYQKALQISRGLKNACVIHVNSTSQGGGVAELLREQIPLEKALGINSKWLVIKQSRDFFAITKKIHNLLQGQAGALSIKESVYLAQSLRLSGLYLQKYLLSQKNLAAVVLHDPQALLFTDYLSPQIQSVFRLHIDLSTPNRQIYEFLKPMWEKAKVVVVSHKKYKPMGVKLKNLVISAPAISPFVEKNKKISSSQIERLFKQRGIDLSRPVICQVSRFDPWKDPEGVIEAFYLAKKEIPALQLVLEGSQIAKDDPESAAIYQKLLKQYGKSPDIFLFGNPKNKKPNNLWVNALQARSDIVIQKSLKEGFGLTITEALWKQKPVIAGDTPGIRLQIKNGKTGFLVKSPQACAAKIVVLIKKPGKGRAMGRRGHMWVKKHFLFSRQIYDFLKLYNEVYLKK